VPLKTASQHFILYKIIVLPARTSGNIFVKYSADFSYFGIDNSHRDILFTEEHRNRCTTSSVTLCPADVAIYSQQNVNSESSLFFQTSTSNKLYRRNLVFHYRTPTLQRHGLLLFIACRSNVKLPYAARAQTVGRPAQKHFLIPD
jgi:hypothetical protein